MQIAHIDSFDGPVTSPEFRGGGKEFRTLLRGREGTPGNYRMVHARQTGHVAGPRHRHNFDQLRFCLDGRMNYGPDKWIAAGEIAYFPEGAFYGPEESGEARVGLTIQFGGASGHGFLDEREQLRAMEAMKAQGAFEGGVYRRSGELAPGERRNQDAFEAIWEYVNKKRIDYPAPRYDAPVLMRPDRFAWVADGRVSGVAWKRLGRFTERNLDIALLRLDAGARVTLGPRGGESLGFVTRGAGETGGGELRAHSAFATQAGERAELTASAQMELLVVGLPEFE